jgi:putative transposase
VTNEILKAYKVRLYPNPDQAVALNKTFGCVRVLWNHLVANFNSYGTDQYVEKFSEKEIKQNPDLFFLSEVSAASLQQKRMDFAETKSQYFNSKRKTRIGRMQFKKKTNKQSYRLPNQKFKVFVDDGLIQLEKVGKVKAVFDRPISGDLRSVTVSKTPSGKYFASILVKTNVDLLPPTGKSVGIDLGLKDLFIMSSGDVVNNPRWFRENQSKLAKAQRHLSRKKKGSKRYEKQRMKVAKVHEKIANQRNYFLHNMSTLLVKNFDVIITEDLNVAGMKKSMNLGKSVSDAGWAEFVRQLEYKSQWYGRTFVKIDRFYPSSQICSSCGHKDGKKALDIREWTCSNCGTEHDRDLNAANNILVKGYSDLTGLSINDSSAELVDYKRGEDVSLGDMIDRHLATSVKRLDKFIGLS